MCAHSLVDWMDVVEWDRGACRCAGALRRVPHRLLRTPAAPPPAPLRTPLRSHHGSSDSDARDVRRAASRSAQRAARGGPRSDWGAWGRGVDRRRVGLLGRAAARDDCGIQRRTAGCQGPVLARCVRASVGGARVARLTTLARILSVPCSHLSTVRSSSDASDRTLERARSRQVLFHRVGGRPAG